MKKFYFINSYEFENMMKDRKQFLMTKIKLESHLDKFDENGRMLLQNYGKICEVDKSKKI